MKRDQSKVFAYGMIVLALVIIAVQQVLLGEKEFTFTLALLLPIPFIQNMFFTWVSRSRQGGDPDHHRYAAWGSNGVWAMAQAVVAANIYKPVMDLMGSETTADHTIIKMLLSILIYSIATAEGSVLMMKIRLGWFRLPKMLLFLEEKGKTKVGSR